jgi:hypothetical protein
MSKARWSRISKDKRQLGAGNSIRRTEKGLKERTVGIFFGSQGKGSAYRRNREWGILREPFVPGTERKRAGIPGRSCRRKGVRIGRVWGTAPSSGHSRMCGIAQRLQDRNYKIGQAGDEARTYEIESVEGH